MPHPSTVEFILPDGSRRDTGLCERNLNLLAHAQAIELPIGSRCGGHGVCGGDRVRILPGNGAAPALSAPTEAELRHLSAEEIRDGWRLACQCFPEASDQAIEASVFRTAPV